MNKLKQLLCLGCCVFSTMFFLAGCGGTNPGQGQQTATKPATDEGLAYKSFEELDGKKMGVATGTILDKITNKYLPHSPLAYYNNTADMVYALKSGKIEGFLGDEPVVRSLVASNTGIGYFKKKVQDDQYGIGISKKKPELKQIIDEALTRYRQDGTLKKVDTAWFGTDESLKKMPEPKTGGKGTVRVAVSPDTPPLDYIKDGEVTGYEPYLVRKILQDAGYTVTFITMDFGGLMPALASGKADIIISTITITEERKKSLLFSEPDYVGGIVLVVKNKNSASDGEDIWTGLKSSFTKNFLLEDRYKLIGQGLKNTVAISLGSAIFGTILGFGLCLLRRSPKKYLNLPAGIFVKIMQGTPMVVFLMIMYYVVFGGYDINPIIVAILAFALNEAAYMGEMMRTGIDAVDKGQTEAAYAMGFSPVQTFVKIVVPQAVRQILPVYTGEFVSLVKMTSVVGYIAIQDLTKMSDIIRSRTYEAFFPLIMTALIYFLVAWVLTSALSYLEYKIDPKKRSRTLKGVRV